jgi:hypothetical protein
MLGVERTREILADTALSDHEIEMIRDNFRDLAEIIFNKWHKDSITMKTYGKQANDS